MIRCPTIAVSACPHGCTVLVLVDENDQPVASAHVPAEAVESLVASLREVTQECEATRRPPV